MIKISKETMALVEAVKAVYGKFPDVPEGYEVIGFGEVGGLPWLDAFGSARTDSINHGYHRLILRKLPPPPPPVLKAEITTEEIYPGGYEISAGYKVLGFGRKDDFPSATHYLAVHPGGGISCGPEPITWIGSNPRRIFLEKI